MCILASSTNQKPRPFSAKFSTNTPKVESSVRESRVASAGPRRQPFIRPSIRNSLAVSKGQTTDYSIPAVTESNWPTKPPIANSSASQGNNTYGSINTPSHNSTLKSTVPQSSNGQTNQDKLSSSVTAADIRKSLEGAAYDSNGIRLDRTPTDEEINWLWDKVRICLSRQSTVDSTAGDNNSERSGSASVQPRQTAQVSNKYIDGTTLAPQLRTSTRMFANYNGNATTNENSTFNSTYPRKKISMDTLNTYNRRATSTTQKKSPAINNGYIHTNGSTNNNINYASAHNPYGNGIYHQTSQHHYPAHSHLGPAPSVAVANGYNEEGKTHVISCHQLENQM